MSSIATAVTGAGCTVELLTYGCANAILTHMVIKEQLEKRHRGNQLRLLQLFYQASSLQQYPGDGMENVGT